MSRISALTELSTLANADVLPIVDATDTTTKKVTVGTLLGGRAKTFFVPSIVAEDESAFVAALSTNLITALNSTEELSGLFSGTWSSHYSVMGTYRQSVVGGVKRMQLMFMCDNMYMKSTFYNSGTNVSTIKTYTGT